MVTVNISRWRLSTWGCQSFPFERIPFIWSVCENRFSFWPCVHLFRLFRWWMNCFFAYQALGAPDHGCSSITIDTHKCSFPTQVLHVQDILTRVLKIVPPGCFFLEMSCKIKFKKKKRIFLEIHPQNAKSWACPLISVDSSSHNSNFWQIFLSIHLEIVLSESGNLAILFFSCFRLAGGCINATVCEPTGSATC